MKNAYYSVHTKNYSELKESVQYKHLDKSEFELPLDYRQAVENTIIWRPVWSCSFTSATTRRALRLGRCHAATCMREIGVRVRWTPRRTVLAKMPAVPLDVHLSSKLKFKRKHNNKRGYRLLKSARNVLKKKIFN